MRTVTLEVLVNICIDRFLLVAFVKYILSQIYSHCIQNWAFWYFIKIVETFVFWRKYFQGPLIFMFFYPKASNFHNPGMIGRRNLHDPSMNNILNVLSINCNGARTIECGFTLKRVRDMIRTYNHFYRLVYNIHSYLIDLILTWSALLQ